MIIIIDTNVAVVTNGKSPQASPACVIECIRRLRLLTGGSDRLALDDNWRILNQYKGNMRSQGEPGIGDAFLKWVLDNRLTGRIEYVTITPDDTTTFAEFPSDERLKKFDPKDRVFVAVAKAHGGHPPILNAVDTDWWHFKAVLKENGVEVEFLCPNDIQRLS